ncbi:MAG: hypothetical protein IKH88_09465 [Prevotella sp.]|nr:hypothetical protein [Prevotella sp.]
MHLIMQRWKRALVWLGRIGHCRGFGVQSPTDYRFVRYVINEHAPYYAYDDLSRRLPALDGLTRKMCKLYFRLSNHCQAVYFIDVKPVNEAYGIYVKAACGKTQKLDLHLMDEALVPFDTPFLARAECCEDNMGVIRHLLEQADDHCVVVVEGIKESRQSKACWKALQAAEQAMVTYDLYYCGIIITTKKRYKKNYIINF